MSVTVHAVTAAVVLVIATAVVSTILIDFGEREMLTLAYFMNRP